jgi:hypothetical protein
VTTSLTQLTELGNASLIASAAHQAVEDVQRTLARRLGSGVNARGDVYSPTTVLVLAQIEGIAARYELAATAAAEKFSLACEASDAEQRKITHDHDCPTSLSELAYIERNEVGAVDPYYSPTGTPQPDVDLDYKAFLNDTFGRAEYPHGGDLADLGYED